MSDDKKIPAPVLSRLQLGSQRTDNQPSDKKPAVTTATPRALPPPISGVPAQNLQQHTGANLNPPTNSPKPTVTTTTTTHNTALASATSGTSSNTGNSSHNLNTQQQNGLSNPLSPRGRTKRGVGLEREKSEQQNPLSPRETSKRRGGLFDPNTLQTQLEQQRSQEQNLLNLTATTSALGRDPSSISSPRQNVTTTTTTNTTTTTTTTSVATSSPPAISFTDRIPRRAAKEDRSQREAEEMVAPFLNGSDNDKSLSDDDNGGFAFDANEFEVDIMTAQDEAANFSNLQTPRQTKQTKDKPKLGRQTAVQFQKHDTRSNPQIQRNTKKTARLDKTQEFQVIENFKKSFAEQLQNQDFSKTLTQENLLQIFFKGLPPSIQQSMGSFAKKFIPVFQHIFKREGDQTMFACDEIITMLATFNLNLPHELMQLVSSCVKIIEQQFPRDANVKIDSTTQKNEGILKRQLVAFLFEETLLKQFNQLASDGVLSLEKTQALVQQMKGFFAEAVFSPLNANEKNPYILNLHATFEQIADVSQYFTAPTTGEEAIKELTGKVSQDKLDPGTFFRGNAISPITKAFIAPYLKDTAAIIIKVFVGVFENTKSFEQAHMQTIHYLTDLGNFDKNFPKPVRDYIHKGWEMIEAKALKLADDKTLNAQQQNDLDQCKLNFLRDTVLRNLSGFLMGQSFSRNNQDFSSRLGQRANAIQMFSKIFTTQANGASFDKTKDQEGFKGIDLQKIGSVCQFQIDQLFNAIEHNGMIAWEKPITSEFITENYLTGLNGIMFDQPAFKPHTHDKNVCYQFTRDAAGVYLDGQPILDKSDIDVDGQNSDRINRVAKKLIDFTGSPEQALLVSRFANQDFGLSFIFKMLTGQLSQNNESFIRLGDGVPVTPVIPKSL